MPMDERAEMTQELQQLRRGHGLHATDVTARVGPRLATVCGLTLEMPLGEQRKLLVEKISATVLELPEDLGLAVQAAFALEPASTSRFLRERMQWLGQRLDRDPRTAVRRVETGLTLLAELLLAVAASGTAPGDNTYAPDGWHVSRLRSTWLMHLDPTQLLETRRIACTRDGLDAITVSWSVPVGPGAPPDLRVEMLYGGELEKNEAESTAHYWSGVIRLPHPLTAGEQHEYQLRVSSSRDHLRPYYVLTPFRRFDEFVLRAKFDPANLPERIWRLDGVPFQLLEEAQPDGDQPTTDTVGEIEGTFRNLRQGLSYGFRWLDPLAGGA